MDARGDNREEAPLPGRTLWGRAVGALALRGAEKALTFAALALAAAWLGTGAYGDLATALAVLGLVALLGGLGLPQVLLRFLPAYAVQGRVAESQDLIRAALGAGALASLGVAGAVSLGVAVAGPAAGTALVIAAGAAVPVVMLRLLAHLSLAEGRILAGQVGESLVRPALTLAALALAVGAGLPGTAAWAAGCWAGAAVLALAVQVPLSAPRLSPVRAKRLALTGAVPPAAPVVARAERTAWVRAAAPLLGVALLHGIMAQADVIMLRVLTGAEAAGAYHLAARVALLAGLALAAVNTVTAQPLSAALAQGDLARVRHLAVSTARALALPGLAGLAAVAVLGAPLLALAGPGFAAGAPALTLLWAGQAVNLACGPVALVLALGGAARAVLGGVALGAAVNLTLNALLIPPFGLVGAAVATAVSLAAWNGVLVVRCRARLGLDTTVLGRPARAVG